MSCEVNRLENSEIEEIVSDVLSKYGAVKEDMEVSAGSQKGDGYLSFLVRVDVKARPKSFNLMLKCAPRDQTARKVMSYVIPSFSNEIHVYSNVHPSFKKFQEDRKVKNCFKSVAKCYKTIKTDGRELLVLDNIKSSGFKLWNSKLPMNKDHVILVLKEYGKYHAISHAMREQDNEAFQKLAMGFEDIMGSKNLTEDVYVMFESNVSNALKVLGDKAPKAGTREYLLWVEKNSGDRKVLLHGDCWCNNMMFNYEDPENPNRPTDLCLLDFQLAKPASPVLDISYFFYAMASKEMLDDLDRYLRIYHDSLAAHLRELGSDVEKIYPFSALKDEWKQYAKFGFIMSLVVLKAMLREKDEVVDFTDGNEDGKTFISAFEDDIRSEAFAERQRNLVLHAYEIGII